MDHQPQHALVAYLATRFGGASLGKKAVQKYIHILSSLTGINFGYEFSFYTYGPFSRELASDLDLLAASKAVKVIYDGEAYSITSTPLSARIVDELPDETRQIADRIWGKFAGRTAKQLELVSTILFIADEEGIRFPSQQMTDRVKALKPKYSISEIETAQLELSRLDL